LTIYGTSRKKQKKGKERKENKGKRKKRMISKEDLQGRRVKAKDVTGASPPQS